MVNFFELVVNVAGLLSKLTLTKASREARHSFQFATEVRFIEQVCGRGGAGQNGCKTILAFRKGVPTAHIWHPFVPLGLRQFLHGYRLQVLRHEKEAPSSTGRILVTGWPFQEFFSSGVMGAPFDKGGT